jgi:hypothetical protein
MSNVLTLFPHHNIADSLRALANEIDSGEVELSKLLLCGMFSVGDGELQLISWAIGESMTHAESIGYMELFKAQAIGEVL